MQIFVRLLSGKLITLDVTAADKITSVKEKVQKAEGLEPEKQQLIFSGNTLENDKSLGDYNIAAENTLFLVIKDIKGSSIMKSGASSIIPEAKAAAKPASDEIQLNIKAMEGIASGFISIKKTDTIRKLKKLVAEKNNVADPDSLIIYNEQNKLNNADTVTKANLKDGDNITVVVGVSGGIN